MGGTSSERAVSLQSGANIAEALTSLGKYEVIPVDLTSDSLSGMPDGIDAAYIALHGGWGENGGVQAALNARAIPYTGPGVVASRIAMDKIETKKVLEQKGVPTAPWAIIPFDAAESPLPLPVVVKPPCDGSSVGVSKVASPEAWRPALATACAALKSPSDLLVEAFVPGREMTVGLIDGEPLPVIEIVAPGGWYGYDEKYKSNETRYPFLEDAPLAAKLQQLARAAWDAVGCRGVTRVDFRVAPDGACYVLELNTSPGFTAHSLVPKAGIRAGYTFAGVCERILASACTDEMNHA